MRRISVVTYSREPDPITAKSEISILFLGDMMFDRDIRSLAVEKGYGYLFDCTRDLLTGSDFVVANLEGPITDYKSVSVGTNPSVPANFQFTFDPAITDALLLANIGYVNLGNNHILNFGKEGLKQTREYLDKAGIKYFGEPYATTSIAYIESPSGKKIALINYNQFWNGTPEAVGDLVTIEKEAGNLAVVYAHWGDEYVSTTESQREVSHLFIEAGADAVIGSHPHVVQSIEEYKGRMTFFSLGNFIFDQYFSNAVKHRLGARMIVNKEGTKVKFETIELVATRDGKVCPAVVESKNEI